jgi:hypothetical protein
MPLGTVVSPLSGRHRDARCASAAAKPPGLGTARPLSDRARNSARRRPDAIRNDHVVEVFRPLRKESLAALSKSFS